MKLFTTILVINNITLRVEMIMMCSASCPVLCPAGARLDVATQTCVSCRSGQYQSAEGQLTCFSCPSGRTSEVGAFTEAQCECIKLGYIIHVTSSSVLFTCWLLEGNVHNVHNVSTVDCRCIKSLWIELSSCTSICHWYVSPDLSLCVTVASDLSFTFSGQNIWDNSQVEWTWFERRKLYFYCLIEK